MQKYILATKRVRGEKARRAASADLQRLLRSFDVPLAILGETKTEGEFGRHVTVVNASTQRIERSHPFPDSIHVELAFDYSPAGALCFRIMGDDGPLTDARVLGWSKLDPQTTVRLGGVADADGLVTLSPDHDDCVLEMLAVRPFGGYWSRIVPDPKPNTTITCAKLPNGPAAWWHDLMGISARSNRGRGVRVGVIDTGVGPHPCISVHDLGTFLNGAPATVPGKDDDGHGTHVAGLIGARAFSAAHFSGAAPGVQLASARVSGEASVAHQGDIANALDALCAKFDPHLVNISLASKRRSDILHDAILDALERGTLCICAAGNEGAGVEFPAAYPECVGVSALGKRHWGAPLSLATLHQPNDPIRYGHDDLYLASFSCYGPSIFCAAPGVGIISTLPSRSGQALFAEMDGTSMSSPLVCGVLAARLAEDADYLNNKGTRERSERAKMILAQSCKPVGLPSLFVGHGCPAL